LGPTLAPFIPDRAGGGSAPLDPPRQLHDQDGFLPRIAPPKAGGANAQTVAQLGRALGKASLSDGVGLSLEEDEELSALLGEDASRRRRR
jgi:hypothetical protein